MRVHRLSAIIVKAALLVPLYLYISPAITDGAFLLLMVCLSVKNGTASITYLKRPSYPHDALG
jgi:hypothetical protein